jgi:hypothetical protein
VNETDRHHEDIDGNARMLELSVTQERDIDCVLITGAGSSRDMAVGNDHFPLMGDWLATLSSHIAKLGTQFLDATDLREASTGPEFEERLGNFLRRVQAFNQIEALVNYTANFPSTPQNLYANQTIGDWYSQSKNAFERIV